MKLVGVPSRLSCVSISVSLVHDTRLFHDGENSFFDAHEKDVDNAEYAVRGELKRWNKVLEKFTPGAYCKVPCRTNALAEAAGVGLWEKAPAMVISQPRVEKGGIMLDVLIAGQVISFYSRNVTTR